MTVAAPQGRVLAQVADLFDFGEDMDRERVGNFGEILLGSYEYYHCSPLAGLLRLLSLDS